MFRRGKLEHFREDYRRHLRKIAHRLDMPDIRRCTFKVYRDYVGTWVYEESGFKSEVAMLLGHLWETSTTTYIVRKALAPKHYHTRIAQTTEEEVELSNLGYDYVKDTVNGGSLWRKRKR